MSKAVSIFKNTPKSNIIKAYRHYLKTNKRWRKKNDGFGKKNYCNLERPKINGEVYSWRQFAKLPKESVIVHVFTEGCDSGYLENLTEKGFFNPRDYTGLVYINGHFVKKPEKSKKKRRKKNVG